MNELRETSHQLPDGSWVALRLECDPLYSEWTCFWLTFIVGKIRPASYRVFRVGTQPPEWKLMKPAKAVDKQTDPDDDLDEDPEETARHNMGKVGAARKLSKGRYVLQCKVAAATGEVELPSVAFEVHRGPHAAGWG